MKKNIKRINESQLRAIVAESVKKVLNEGTTDQEVMNKFYQIAEGIGMEQFIGDMTGLCSEEQLKYYVSMYERDGFFNNEENGEDNESINESTINEYQFGDISKRIGAGASTLFGLGNGNLRKRWTNTKKNWQTQGDINGLSELLKKLQQFVDAKQLNPNATIGELIGNKFMQRGDKQGIKQRIGSLKGNVTQRGGQWH